MNYLKDIHDEENDIALRENLDSAFDDFLITENDLVDENHDQNLIKLRFKEYLKGKMLQFEKEVASDNAQIKELTTRIKRFLQTSIYL